MSHYTLITPPDEDGRHPENEMADTYTCREYLRFRLNAQRNEWPMLRADLAWARHRESAQHRHGCPFQLVQGDVAAQPSILDFTETVPEHLAKVVKALATVGTAATSSAEAIATMSDAAKAAKHRPPHHAGLTAARTR
jgi:hypothetical protein